MARAILLLTTAFCTIWTEGCGAGAVSRTERGVQAADAPLRLFNGRNLEGFYTFLRDWGRGLDPRRVFTVADGAIRVSGEEWGCITTDAEYADYLLVVEYRWGELTWAPRLRNARDSGILLHSVGEDGAYGGVWMRSIECNIIEGGTGDFIVVGDGSDAYSLTAPVCKERSAGCYQYDPTESGSTATIHSGRINWFARDPSWQDVKGFRGRSDLEKPIGEWNRVECLVVADRMVIKVNGVLANSCREVKPRRGRIQLQSEGAEIFFRRVDLTPVGDDPAAAIRWFSTASGTGGHADGGRGGKGEPVVRST
ncbi:MAG TPA: DUF1080 domain-containing protein [Phycisphaerae bacterium]|nr:DUF1080 domain-containing protein [Phycisphaerae bacterium]HRY67138.1 DUF1080 domain-containing protein [Phycisphaerae bacterium]HSA26493.1 DUF1080 domain-containing protein [Phycisphaerae bacterium]